MTGEHSPGKDRSQEAQCPPSPHPRDAECYRNLVPKSRRIRTIRDRLIGDLQAFSTRGRNCLPNLSLRAILRATQGEGAAISTMGQANPPWSPFGKGGMVVNADGRSPSARPIQEHTIAGVGEGNETGGHRGIA